MTHSEYRPRLYCDVSEETCEKVRTYLKGVTQGEALRQIFEKFADKLEENPIEVNTALMLGTLDIDELFKFDVAVLEARRV